MNFLKGKKTYIIIGLFAVLAVLTLVVNIVVPEAVYAILIALGVGCLRAGIAAISGNKGWKTYVAVVAVVGIAIAQAAGIVLPFEVIYGVLGALGIVGVRSAVQKLE